MSNPHVDKIQKREINLETGSFPYDRKDDSNQLEDFDRSFEIDAIIKSLNSDSTDAYVVDLYEKGFAEDKTREDVVAHAMHTGDWFFEKDRIRVRLMPDHTAWIVHDPTPQLAITVASGPDGEEERDDNYYYVSLSRIWNTGAGVAPYDIHAYDGAKAKIVLAENISEHLSGNHTVPIGTPVVLQWDWDRSNPIPKRRYFFQSGGSALPPPRLQFMVLQLMDGAGAVDWDYTKGHI